MPSSSRSNRQPSVWACGGLGTLYAVNADERLNHTFEAVSGVLGDECAELLRSFFARKRKKRMESK